MSQGACLLGLQTPGENIRQLKLSHPARGDLSCIDSSRGTWLGEDRTLLGEPCQGVGPHTQITQGSWALVCATWEASLCQEARKPAGWLFAALQILWCAILKAPALCLCWWLLLEVDALVGELLIGILYEGP